MDTRVDMIFKGALLAILAIFLFLYAEGRGVGRYSYLRDGELEFVLDTATGVVYQGGYAMNHLTGQEGLVNPGKLPPAKPAPGK